MKNSNLHNAKRAKNDEFYTRIADIEKELYHYRPHFKNKVVFCNCDDPVKSMFTRHFAQAFDLYKLKKVICTHYAKDGQAYKLEIKKQVNDLKQLDKMIKTPLKGNGDFRSEESIELLKQADIVVTNPPFSLFREFIAQLIEYDKKFLVIGNHNAITYKEIFPLIKNNKLWVGMSPRSMSFIRPDGSEKQVNACWFTNLSHKKRNEKMILFRRYTPEVYPKYDNYDAIEVSKTADIPMDYDGVMGVPISWFDKYNPDQFEILECHEPCINLKTLRQNPKFKEYKSRQMVYNGILCQKTYHRFFIRRK